MDKDCQREIVERVDVILGLHRRYGVPLPPAQVAWLAEAERDLDEHVRLLYEPTPTAKTAATTA